MSFKTFGDVYSAYYKAQIFAGYADWQIIDDDGKIY